MTEDTPSSPLTTLTGTIKNVGVAGGDLQTRVVAAVGLGVLIVMIVPAAGVPFTTFKITTLIGAEIGAVLLMLGLFFSKKTHFAGFVLIPIPLLMLWLVGSGQPWLAIVVGLAFLGEGLLNLFTRRCRLNKMLGINSCGR